CDSGTYGKDCSFSCNPNCLKDTCDSKTGHCIDGCIDGYTTPFCNESCSLGTYGQRCSENCSANCINETCSNVNGSCDCKPGFQGNTCDQECNPGSYGNHCNQNCSANCINNCSTVDGSCKCKPGFQGNHCNRDCDLDYYGDQCSLQCSTNCIKSLCNNINGSCSCVPGYTGDKCDQECPEHTYGDNCLENCNQTCLNTVCSNINGRCKNGCIPGKEGDFCQFDCQSGKYGKNCKEDCSVTCGGNGLCHQVFGNCSEGCQDGFKGDKCSEAISADEDQSNDAAVAIPIVLVILIIVAILLGAIFWRRRKAKKAAHAQEGNLQKLTNVAAEDNQLARIEVETDSKVNNDVEYYNTALEIADTRVPVDKLHNYLRTHNKAFFEEQFLKIHTSTNSPTHIGSLAENKLKNRYKNILPYDHCRVHLSINTEKKHGDYINASFVKSYQKNEKFIASQGPNKVILEDFVRMLWEQKIDKVVMLTNLVEEAKQKCEQYWPKEGDEEIGQFRLRLINTEVFADCVIRKLEISVTGEATHNLTQYHFTSWPDKGVPATAWSLVDFEQRVSFHLTQRPIVVHCSAGVGRTGTFIALHNVMCQAEDTGYIDFFQTLSKLRIDRMLMIQTAEQYLFLHKAALVAMLCINTTVHQNDIGEHLKQLETKLVSGETLFEKEFKAICDVCAENHDEDDDEGSGGSASSTYLNSRSVNNRAKNRFSNILPKDSYRPFLHSDNKEYGDYINAVALPSFTRLNQQYLTQLPLPSTVIDFWRLVTQMKVSLIIAFDLDLQDTDTTIGNYLPSSKGQQQHFGPVIVETMNSIKDESWEELTLTATIHKKRKKLSTSSTHNEETTVTHLKFTGNVHDGEKLLKFISYARSHSAQRVGKVVYTCRNGADLSGLACVLSLLLDRMDHDHHITVPLVVGALKTVRPQIIPTLVQYKLLYSILQQYSQCNNIYGNVASANVSTQSRNQKEEDNNIYANS
ncbi:receptor-type tyrosine-protein phosphatase epsilon, partial [Biomphalaria pfeifferi]